MDDALTVEYAPSRFYAVLIAAFSTTGLGLMAIGLFVVLSHAVAGERTRSACGWRSGASRPDVVWLVLANGLAPLAAGIAVETASASAACRMARHSYNKVRSRRLET